MNIKPGDYIKGIETYGPEQLKREMRGTVSHISGNKYSIQADDSLGGARGTLVDIDGACIVNKVDKWWEANERLITPGTRYMHFKGNIYKVIAIAEHVDCGKCVVYKREKDGTVWIREYAEFASEVDHKKYPDVTQHYRFEEVKD